MDPYLSQEAEDRYAKLDVLRCIVKSLDPATIPERLAHLDEMIEKVKSEQVNQLK